MVVSFEDDLAAAKSASRPSVTVPIELNGKRYKIRYTRMVGTEYASETLRHAPDMGIALHREYGYDIHSLSRAIAPKCAVLVDGRDERELSAEQWAELFAVLDGGALGQVANAVFQLNEFASAKAVAAARKVLDGTALV